MNEIPKEYQKIIHFQINEAKRHVSEVKEALLYVQKMCIGKSRRNIALTLDAIESVRIDKAMFLLAELKKLPININKHKKITKSEKNEFHKIFSYAQDSLQLALSCQKRSEWKEVISWDYFIYLLSWKHELKREILSNFTTFYVNNYSPEEREKFSYDIETWEVTSDKLFHEKFMGLIEYFTKANKKLYTKENYKNRYPSKNEIQVYLWSIYEEFNKSKKIYASKRIFNEQVDHFTNQYIEDFIEQKAIEIITKNDFENKNRTEKCLETLINEFSNFIENLEQNFVEYCYKNFIERCKKSHEKKSIQNCNPKNRQIQKSNSTTDNQNTLTNINEYIIPEKINSLITYISELGWKKDENKISNYLCKNFKEGKKLRINYLINKFMLTADTQTIDSIYKRAKRLNWESDKIQKHIENTESTVKITQKNEIKKQKEIAEIPKNSDELLKKFESLWFYAINYKKILKQAERVLFKADTNNILKEKCLSIMTSEKRITKRMANKNGSIALYWWRIRIKHIEGVDYIMWIMSHNDYDRIIKKIHHK